MADRDQALAEFQAITGNDDIEECIVILEQHDWNFMEAVQNTLAGTDNEPNLLRHSPNLESGTSGNFTGFQPLPDASRSSFPLNEGIIGQSVHSVSSQRVVIKKSAPDTPSIATASASASFLPSTSCDLKSSPSRLLNFNIEYRDHTIPLTVFDNEKVGKLKELLVSETGGVSVDKQELCGWVNKNNRKVLDEDVLCDLKLPRDNTLFLLTPEVTVNAVQNPTNGEDCCLFERLTQTFTLKIHFKDKDQTYTLNFPGSKTIQEVKGDVYSLIDVPVSKQVWDGWPAAAKDDTMTLAGSQIGFPCHGLNVRSSRVKQSSHPTHSEDMDLDNDEDFEDAHDHFSLEDNFLDPEMVGTRKPEPLMPDNAANEEAALEMFSNEFSERFGECHPVFYIGNLEEALKDSLQCQARERKLLAIYLHHDSSILANVFCSQVLCSESVVSYLSSNFITWAWDLTSEANHARLLSLCNRHFGNLAASTVRNIKPDELPLLLLISRNRGTNEVVNAIRGNITLDELMSHLINATESFREQLQGEIQEEFEREVREKEKLEQDRAYQESLAVDKAKAEAKLVENKEKEKLVLEEAKKEHEEAEAKQLEEETKEAVRQSIANQLPSEPPAESSEATTAIRFRCPNGQSLVRRFLVQDTLQILLNYVASEGYSIAEHKVLTTYPRKDLTQMDSQVKLEDLKLYPQETLILEEK